MNLLLIDEHEVTASRAIVGGRRAVHLRQILKVQIGTELRAGLVGRGLCTARVTSMTSGTYELQLSEISPQVTPLIHVVLALPRPKVLSRIVANIASFGVKSITLLGAWRVEKSYFSSPRLLPNQLNEALRLGCEQGMQCHHPEFRIEQGFRRYVEDIEPTLFPENTFRAALHPHAPSDLKAACVAHQRCLSGPFNEVDTVLAFGPEGGFIDTEIASLEQAGYRLATLGTGPLRSEVAISAAFGQLLVLR